jgi:hypothetical protein
MTFKYWAVAPLMLGLMSGCSDDESNPNTGGSGGRAGSGGSSGAAGSPGGSGGSAGSSAGGDGGSAGTANTAGSAGTANTAGSAGSAGSAGDPDAGADAGDGSALTFFVSSEGMGAEGGDFGGLDGADALCDRLATAVGAGDHTWRAFLSTDDIDARSRIGNGPWQGADGSVIAATLDALFEDGIPQAGRALRDENNVVIPQNIHDIVTGSDQDGTGLDGLNCDGWESNDAADQTVVGHSDGNGPQGADSDFGWVRAHPAGNNTNCNQAGLAQGGGDGRIYCFAAD